VGTLSVVVPIHNQEPLLLPIYDRLTAVLERIRRPYEIIFVDDDSTDNTFDLLSNLVETDSRLKIIRLARRFGDASALAAGFDEAQGTYVVAFGGTLQYDPEDIPSLLEKLNDGYDLVAGYRRPVASLARRTLNRWMAKAACAPLRDMDGTLHAYRASIIKSLPTMSDPQRLFFAMAHHQGAHIAEVPVAGHVGAFKPSITLAECLAVWLLLRTLTRPLRFLGTVGLTIALVGLLALPWFAIPGATLLLIGLLLIATGLLCELHARGNREQQGRRIYSVREIRTRREEKAAGAGGR
jgi:hypothetical protein